MPGALAVSLFVALGLASPLPAHARDATRIALVVDQPRDRLATLLRYEIEGLGLTVVSLTPEAGVATTPKALEALARAAHAAAAIHIVSSGNAVEVWIADRVTGKIVLRELVEDNGSAVGDKLVVLRTIELLRASLLEAAAPHPSRGEVVATPALQPLIEVRGPVRHTLGVGAGFVASPGGVGPVAVAAVSYLRSLSPRAGIDLWAQLPVAARLEAIEGSATVAPWLMGVGLYRQWSPGEGRVRFTLGAGAAALWMRIHATAQAPFVASVDQHLTGVGLGRAGLSLAVAHQVGVTADVASGIALQRSVVRFADATVATWGRPLVAGSLRLEVGWR